jgi:hypothetical protein
MSIKLVLANESTAARRRAYFHVVDATDGMTPETGEAAGQPQISTNGGAWTNTGIGTLTHIGSGRYYADLTQAALATNGDVIVTRYKSAATAEIPGTSFHVVAFDPHDAAALGLSRLDTTVGSRSSHAAADVWAAGTRTLTSYGTLVADIWAAGTRTLTSYGTLVADIWAAGTRTLTSYGTLVSDVTTAVWAAGTRTLSAFGFSVTVGTNNDKSGYSLSGAGVTAIDTELSAAHGAGSWEGGGGGGGGGATAAEVWSYGTRELTGFGSLPAAIDSQLSASHGAGLWGGAAGSGSVQHTHTVTVGGAPADGVQVWVTAGTDPTVGVLANGFTNSLGQVTFYLDPGSYYLWRQRGGLNFSNPTAITVTP